MRGEIGPQEAPEGFLAWLQAGREAGWVTPVYCARHGWPDDAAHLEREVYLGWDPCLPSLMVTIPATRCRRSGPSARP